MYKVTGDEKLYLVEFRIQSEDSALRVYTLYVDGERAIYQKKRPILFFSPKHASKALSVSTCGAAKIKKIPKQVECVYDFHQAFQDDLQNPKKKTTRHGNLLECLIVLNDYCHDTMNIKEKWKVWMPPQPPSDEEPRYKIRLLPEWQISSKKVENFQNFNQTIFLRRLYEYRLI